MLSCDRVTHNVCGNPVFGALISTDNPLVGPFHRCYIALQ